MICVKNKVLFLRGSNMRVREPSKTPIKWSEKECLRGSDTKLRGPKREFSKPS